MVNISMVLHEQWEDRNQVINYLSRQLINGRIALILGAGISLPFGLHDWETLIEKIYKTKNLSLPPHRSLKQLAEFFKTEYCNNSDKIFAETVRDCLYPKPSVDIKELLGNPTLASISALIMKSARGNISNVVTFNFDELLEIYLEYHGILINLAHSDCHWASSADVSIYHPHGFLPIRDDAFMSESIILDQASYSKVIGKSENMWHQELLTIFRTHTCLFIGLSGNDDNFDSLLLEGDNEHKRKKNKAAYWGVTFATSKDEISRQLWRNRGVFMFNVENYLDDLSETLFRICQQAVKIRKQIT